MKITFLGTGTSQGVPVIACNCNVCVSKNTKDQRLRTSIMIQVSDYTFVIDAGPDFRQQMLRERVENLDAILLTHEHKDHIGGMDDVRAFNFKKREPMDIFCDERVKEAIMREYQYVFASDRYPGVPMMNLELITENPIYLFDQKILPIKAYHRELPVYGFRFDTFTYLTDVNSIPYESKALIIGSKYLVINALRKEKHQSHFTLNEALALITEIKPEKAFITHIGHQMGLHEEVSTELPENVVLAYDGLSFETEI